MSVFITAEVGINANGNIEIAKDLIDVAKKAGCNAVKFQKRNIEKVYAKEYLDLPRESPWGKTQRDQKAGLEFGQDEYEIIDSYCRKVGIEWFASCWDLDSLEFIDQFNCPYNKIASALIHKKELVEAIANQPKHVFMSTAMHSDQEIVDAVKIFEKADCSHELMHCIGTYPMDNSDASLREMERLKNQFDCPIGYSGHEAGLQISLAAAAMGASSIERHITLDRTMYGSDQAASLEPHGLATLVRDIRIIEEARGPKKSSTITKEIEIRKKLEVAW